MEENRKFLWNAKDYAKHSSAQQEWARELIAKLKLKTLCKTIISPTGVGERAHCQAEVEGP